MIPYSCVCALYIYSYAMHGMEIETLTHQMTLLYATAEANFWLRFCQILSIGTSVYTTIAIQKYVAITTLR